MDVYTLNNKYSSYTWIYIVEINNYTSISNTKESLCYEVTWTKIDDKINIMYII